MNCDRFEEWLDEGRPPEGRTNAEAHAAKCSACAAQLEADGEIRVLLASRFAQAPASFTDRVLARLPERAPVVAPPELEPMLPWWIRAVQEPATALSLLAAGLLSVAGRALWLDAQQALPVAGRWVERAAEWNLPGGTAATGAVLLVSTSLLAFAAPALWEFFSRLARPGAR